MYSSIVYQCDEEDGRGRIRDIAIIIRLCQISIPICNYSLRKFMKSPVLYGLTEGAGCLRTWVHITRINMYVRI